VVEPEKEVKKEKEKEEEELQAGAQWEYNVGDSCCFGTRSVSRVAQEMEFWQRDCVWRMHGGIG
jgi:hypothetical protein